MGKGEIMTRVFLLLLFAAALTITAFSQAQNQLENTPVCNLSLSQAPAIRGIRLGMKPDEWLKLFPGSAHLTLKADFTPIIQQRREADKQKSRAAFKP
jgi:hypothetical protein